jgi:hypothetical protein
MAHYVCITGGRDLDDDTSSAAVRDVIGFLHAFYGAGLRILHGDARGIDSLAQRWAEHFGVRVKAYPADWGRGKRAGIERNEHMAGLLLSWEALGHTTEILAFPGGRGTAHMASFSEQLGLSVTHIPIET